MFGEWASQVVRLWAGASDVQLQFDVGPIDVRDGMGKEVVSIVGVPGLATQSTFFTDSNGRDTMTRVRNERPTFNYTVLEPIAGTAAVATMQFCNREPHLLRSLYPAGNFYPANIAYVRDVAAGLTLAMVTDRAQAASSIIDGELQLNVQRRLLHVSPSPSPSLRRPTLHSPLSAG